MALFDPPTPPVAVPRDEREKVGEEVGEGVENELSLPPPPPHSPLLLREEEVDGAFVRVPPPAKDPVKAMEGEWVGEGLPAEEVVAVAQSVGGAFVAVL